MQYEDVAACMHERNASFLQGVQGCHMRWSQRVCMNGTPAFNKEYKDAI